MRRIPVRLKASETLSAFQLTRDTVVTLGNGYEEDGRAGDWVLTKGSVVQTVVTDAVYRARYEPVDERGLLLSGADRTTLERALGFGATETTQHLLTAVARLARLRIGAIDVDFTPGQWEELAARSTKRGITVETLVRQVVDKITSEIWHVASGA